MCIISGHVFVCLKCWEWWKQFIYVWKNHTVDIKRVSLGKVWKNREPQTNNWLNTRKCALKRRDLAIEDGIITWWVAAGSGEGLTLKLSLVPQSLSEGRGRKAEVLGWTVDEFCCSPGVQSGCPAFGGRLWFVSRMCSALPSWIYLECSCCLPGPALPRCERGSSCARVPPRGCCALAVLGWCWCYCLGQHRLCSGWG